VKLPDIEYGPVQRSSDALARVDQAQRRASGAIAEGLSRLGMEIVKTESSRASADFTAGLAQAEQAIHANRYISTAKLKELLGGNLDRLDPNVRARVTRKVTGAGGAQLEQDREDIPVWEVAGALFDKRAEELLEQASQHIGAQGWRTEFVAKAKEDLAIRKSRLAGQMATAALESLKGEQRAIVAQYVRGGRVDDALGEIERSDAFTPGEKALLREQVLKEHGDQDLIARADATARELEAAHPTDPQAAMKAAQALEGKLGAKVAERLHERDRLRTEAQLDEVRERKGRLELDVRASKVVSIAQLEQLDDYKRLPEWGKADIVQILGSVAEQRLRLSQLATDKEWQQELSRFQGLSDREKVQAWASYEAKVPLAYQGGFAQAVNAARMRLTNAWDSEDVQKTFDLAAGSLGWTGERKLRADRLRERGRRWYDAETLRHQGVPPTQADAAKWLAEQLMLGDENGDAWFGGAQRFRFQAEEMAEKAGEPLRFEPYSAEQQRYAPAAALLRERGGGAPAAPAPAAAQPPAGPSAKTWKAGDRVPSEQLGRAAGGVYEYQANGKWKRVQ
jgi:hypothetical protein